MRLVALDALRGATVAAMILVNNPGSWAHVHPQLRHAAWHGCTFTDLVFPFFLFVVGVAIVFSLGRARESGRPKRSQLGRIFKRSVRLIFFGLLMAAWSSGSFADIRIPGVLQRIALCYLAGALLFLYLSRNQLRLVLIGLLAGYWALLTLVPVPGAGPPDLSRPDLNIAAWLDRVLLGGHLWSQSVTWDPEGLLSTLGALGTVLLGVEVGLFLRDRRLRSTDTARLAAAGTAVAAAGWFWSLALPLNKSLWTGSFVLFTGGLAMAALALLLWVIDVHGLRGWAHPLVVYGRNAITIFVLSGLLARTLARVTLAVGDAEVGLRSFYYEALFTSWLSPDLASFAHAVSWVLLCFLIAWLMYRRQWFLRI